MVTDGESHPAPKEAIDTNLSSLVSADVSSSGTIQEISNNMFFYWKHKLKDELVTQMLPEIVPLNPPSTIPPISEESCTSCTTFKPTVCARIYINGVTIHLHRILS